MADIIVRGASGSGKRAILEAVKAAYLRANPDATVLHIKPGDLADTPAAIPPEPPATVYTEKHMMPEAEFRRLFYGHFGE